MKLRYTIPLFITLVTLFVYFQFQKHPGYAGISPVTLLTFWFLAVGFNAQFTSWSRWIMKRIHRDRLDPIAPGSVGARRTITVDGVCRDLPPLPKHRTARLRS